MPTVEFEFVVEGPPYTANKDESKPKTDWKQKVGIAAFAQWIADNRPVGLLPIYSPIEAYVTTYCREVLYDVDNVLKWTLDGLKEDSDQEDGVKQTKKPSRNKRQQALSSTYKPLYGDDRQIYKITSERVDLNAIKPDPVASLVIKALDDFNEFLHIVIRWEESEA